MEDEKVLNAQEESVEQEEKDSEVDETQDEETQDESVSISKEKFKAMQKKAMAYDALKKAPQTPKKEDITNTLSREEAILIAEGMKLEDLEKLQVIAKGTGKSLLEAKSDPMFTAYYEQVQKERKSEQARLGASKGSGNKENKPNIGSEGLSDEEHKKLWKDLTQK